MEMTAFVADRIFDGHVFLEGAAVLAAEGRVAAVVPVAEVPAGALRVALPGLQLAPALIDLQVYGGRGQMFSLYPTVEALQATYEQCLDGGAAHFMATVATNSPEIMQAAAQAVRAYWAQGLPGLLGLHLEGPYLNPAKKGAHIENYIRQPTREEVDALLRDSGEAIRMMTLAPERCSEEVVRRLLDAGVLVSAGHSNATYAEAHRAFTLGIGTCTHLYNAMSPLAHRAPGLVGAIFDSGVYSSIVADGIHVDFAAVRIARKMMGERLFLITDAVTAASSPSYTYVEEEDRYVTADGTLAGSRLSMMKAVKNCTEQVGVSLEEALRMASAMPAQVAGLASRLGRLAPGWRADMVAFDRELEVRAMVVGGKVNSR